MTDREKMELTVAKNVTVIKEKEVTEREIKNLLKSIGLSPKNIGYFMVVEGIKLMLAEPGYINVTKTLYPKLGKFYSMHTHTIERNIRTAIDSAENAWTKTHAFDQKRTEVFGNVCEHHSNKEFLFCIIDYLSS